MFVKAFLSLDSPFLRPSGLLKPRPAFGNLRELVAWNAEEFQLLWSLQCHGMAPSISFSVVPSYEQLSKVTLKRP